MWTISGQLRKGTTAPGAYGPGNYDYLYDGKLPLHAERAAYDVLLEKASPSYEKSIRTSGDLTGLQTGVSQPKALKDLSRRIGTIKGVKMNSAGFVLQEIVTLL